ncbi:hypothetical protein [Arthrobacter sp. 31Y]|uniref:hypothetical protein n=1 Tax=Arthrobacter sp. 31Y TaxID=1115632 RepID=UPI0004AD0AFB|nr:hypothetical protein [Arthrobacter sp. 31Y]
MATFKINPGTMGEKQVTADEMTLMNDYWYFDDAEGVTVFVAAAKGVDRIQRA